MTSDDGVSVFESVRPRLFGIAYRMLGSASEAEDIVKHATTHFQSTNHPLIKSFEPDEEWGWCFIDELLFESVPGSLTTEWCGVLGRPP